jgi:hypothetical protein
VGSNGRRSHAEKRTPAIATAIISKEDTETDRPDATTAAGIASTTFAIGMAPRRVEVGMTREILVATEAAETIIDRPKIAITAAIEITILARTKVPGTSFPAVNRHETRSGPAKT